MARQVGEVRVPANIPMMDAELSLQLQLVESVVSSDPPGGDDIAYIASAELRTAYLVAARTTLSPPTSARRIALIPQPKLETYRLTAQDRFHLA